MEGISISSILWLLFALFLLYLLITPGRARAQQAAARRTPIRRIEAKRGRLLALSADQILMDRNAAPGPVDPQR